MRRGRYHAAVESPSTLAHWDQLCQCARVISKHKRRARPGPTVSWRDGIHITGTSIWCDAIRARDICFLSTASAMRGAKHAQLIASQDTLRLLGESNNQGGSRLAVPFGQPFTLGTHRIELFSSGHSVGSASLLVNVDSHRVVYAGAINPRPAAIGSALDHRAADILVLSARYGEPRFAFPDPSSEFARLETRCREICGDGGVAILLVRDLGKALTLAARLSTSGLPLRAHRSICDRAKRLAAPAFAELRRWGRNRSEGQILLWPLGTRSRLDPETLPKGSARILVSGSAIAPDRVAAAGAAEGIVLSNQADYHELLRYIASSGAKQIYLTHSSDRGEGLFKALPKLQVEAIGPPQQLPLFES